MGVKVQLADGREVGGKDRTAGEVVEVEADEARDLVARGAARVADSKAKSTTKAASPAGKQD